MFKGGVQGTFRQSFIVLRDCEVKNNYTAICGETKGGRERSLKICCAASPEAAFNDQYSNFREQCLRGEFRENFGKVLLFYVYG